MKLTTSDIIAGDNNKEKHEDKKPYMMIQEFISMLEETSTDELLNSVDNTLWDKLFCLIGAKI